MIAYRYDSSFEGLLSAIFDAYTRKEFPEVLLSGDAALPLLARSAHNVAFSESKASRVFMGLRRRLSRQGQNALVQVWLSEVEGSDMLLFRFMRKVFDAPQQEFSPDGNGIESHFTDTDVLAVSRISQQVGRETHLLLGFARFAKTIDGVYVAVVRPRYNVLTLMLHHFAGRFGAQKWIVYDAGRGYGFLHDAGSFHEVALDDALIRSGSLDASLFAEGETELRDMWCSYFDAATIHERINPRLQRRCMPSRFWPYMLETQSERMGAATVVQAPLRPDVRVRGKVDQSPVRAAGYVPNGLHQS